MNAGSVIGSAFLVSNLLKPPHSKRIFKQVVAGVGLVAFFVDAVYGCVAVGRKGLAGVDGGFLDNLVIAKGAQRRQNASILWAGRDGCKIFCIDVPGGGGC